MNFHSLVFMKFPTKTLNFLNHWSVYVPPPRTCSRCWCCCCYYCCSVVVDSLIWVSFTIIHHIQLQIGIINFRSTQISVPVPVHFVTAKHKIQQHTHSIYDVSMAVGRMRRKKIKINEFEKNGIDHRKKNCDERKKENINEINRQKQCIS